MVQGSISAMPKGLASSALTQVPGASPGTVCLHQFTRSSFHLLYQVLAKYLQPPRTQAVFDALDFVLFSFGLKHFPRRCINSRNVIFMKLFTKTSIHPLQCRSSLFPQSQGYLEKLTISSECNRPRPRRRAI